MLHHLRSQDRVLGAVQLNMPFEVIEKKTQTRAVDIRRCTAAQAFDQLKKHPGDDVLTSNRKRRSNRVRLSGLHDVHCVENELTRSSGGLCIFKCDLDELPGFQLLNEGSDR